jgi:hypothetical protein
MAVKSKENARMVLEIEGQPFKEWAFYYDTYWKREKNYLQRKFDITLFIAEKMIENMKYLTGRQYAFYIVK